MIKKNTKMYKKAVKLLKSAQEYWDACYEANEKGAVRWLKDSDGRLLLFTRGEYVDDIMHSIDYISEVKLFEGEFVDKEKKKLL